MAKKFLTPIGLVNLASDPASGSEGQIYYNTTDDVLKIYVNGAWTTLTGGGGAAINVSASAPGTPSEGDAWFDNTDGKFYVYDGSFWVETGQTDAVFSTYTRWTKVMSASASVLSGYDDSGTNLDFTPGFEQLYINGVFIDESSYTVSSGSAITLDEPVYSTDLVEILYIENIEIANTYTIAQSDDKFLTITSASSTYLTQSNASSTYLTQNNASSIYLSSSAASSTYLTIASASATYEPDIPYVSASPSGPIAGALWIDSSASATPILKVYNGSTWIAVSGATSESGFHPFFGVY